MYIFEKGVLFQFPKLVKDMYLLNRTFHIDEQSSCRQGLYTAEWVHQPSNVIGHPFHHLAWL